MAIYSLKQQLELLTAMGTAPKALEALQPFVAQAVEAAIPFHALPGLSGLSRNDLRGQDAQETGIPTNTLGNTHKPSGRSHS